MGTPTKKGILVPDSNNFTVGEFMLLRKKYYFGLGNNHDSLTFNKVTVLLETAKKLLDYYDQV